MSLIALTLSTASLIPFNALAKLDPEDIMAVTEIYAGQNYGDCIYYSVKKPFAISKKYYDLIYEDSFLSTIGSNRCFLFKWYPNNSTWRSNAIRLNTDNEGNQFKTTGSGTSKTVAAIEAAGLPIYTSSGVPTKILSLFDQSVINSGFVLGVVDSNLTGAYDLSDRVDFYSTSAITSWDGVSYVTNSLTSYESPKYTTLDDRGIKALTEDLASGIAWINAKRTVTETTEEKIEKTNTVYRTEQVIVNNVEYYYVTNKTVVIDPEIAQLDSVLSFTYPKVSVEGSNGVYVIERTGACLDALTVHVLTNGYLCGNLTWESGQSGKRSLKVYYGTSDKFDDNRPMEILVKSLNRKVGTRISEE